MLRRECLEFSRQIGMGREQSANENKKKGRSSLRPSRPYYDTPRPYGFRRGEAFCNREMSVRPDSGDCTFDSVMISGAEVSLP